MLVPFVRLSVERITNDAGRGLRVEPLTVVGGVKGTAMIAWASRVDLRSTGTYRRYDVMLRQVSEIGLRIDVAKPETIC